MKKFLLVFAVAGALVACDNSAADTAQKTKDSLDSVTKLQKESVEEAGEEAKKNLDSTTNAIKDSVDAASNSTSDSTNR